MKNSINNSEYKKIRGIQTSKKSSFTNSLIYKEIGSQLLNVPNKIKNSK
jgi:hypothetical protein